MDRLLEVPCKFKSESNLEEQNHEIESLLAIFPDTLRMVDRKENSVSLQIEVEVHVPESKIEVYFDDNGLLFVDDSDEENENGYAGDTGSFSISVSFLPPMGLYVTFSPSYPTDCPPQVSLTCPWLSDQQLTSLSEELERLWSDGYGMPVIYAWINWLQYNTLSFLQIGSITLPPGKTMEAAAAARPSQANGHFANGLDIYSSQMEAFSLHRLITNYNFERETQEFKLGVHMCHVCFDEKLGREFYRLKCKHAFCKLCISDLCKLHIKEGTVHQIRCLETDCKYPLPEPVIRDAVNTQEFGRWSELSFQKGLSVMGDIEWCPRCSNPVIRDENEQLNLAYCLQCMYGFCTLCREKWHQGELCAHLKVEPEEGRDELSLSRNAKKQLLYRMRKERHSTTAMIRKISKPCPKCRVPIEKIQGCNKVVCLICETTMCYYCGDKIKAGYSHFANKGCQLMTQYLTLRPAPPEPPQEALEIQMQLERNPEKQNELVNCPRCRQQGLRRGHNNHMRCWSCKANYCALCKTFLSAGSILQHFRRQSPCKQHTATIDTKR